MVLSQRFTVALAGWLLLQGYELDGNVERTALVDSFIDWDLGSTDRAALEAVLASSPIPVRFAIRESAAHFLAFMVGAVNAGLMAERDPAPGLLKWYRANEEQLIASAKWTDTVDFAALAYGGDGLNEFYQSARAHHRGTK
jgi:hypothetical protein